MKKNNNSFYKIIDANSNRAKEGLRVAEDIVRFKYSQKKSLEKIKTIRHKIDAAVKAISPSYNNLLSARASESDAGRRSSGRNEFKRENLSGILIPNFKRTQEALRVLEEVSKLTDARISKKFKELRYDVYEAEKEIVLKLINKEN
ncbi:MAG: thiamine-phosphate pyrophosphorylase [Candidatus Goldiibacteriota bacterium]